jgi:hypothetical protein
MYQLCFMSYLTSAEWAAWAEAIGTILAVFAAIFVAGWQTRRQHLDALRLVAEEGRQSRIELAKTLLALANNSRAVLAHLTTKMPDREAVYFIAEGGVHYDLGQLRRIDSSLAAIPLHNLPSSLVTPTMSASAMVRQYLEKVEQVLRVHRSMNGAEFTDFFESRAGMIESLRLTCDDIAKEVEKLDGTARVA